MPADVARSETRPWPRQAKIRAKAAKKAANGPPPNPLDTLTAGHASPEGVEKDRRTHAAGKPDGGGKNKAKERSKLLNFRVTPDFRRAFKRAAAANGCKKHELLERMFRQWAETAPS